MSLREEIAIMIYRLIAPDWVMDYERRERLQEYLLNESYYEGEHDQQFKVKQGQANDNLTLNYSRLVVDRSVALLVGGGIEFDLPGDQDNAPNQDYIDEVWRANNKDISLHKAAQLASIYGNGYTEIIPDGRESKDRENTRVPRLMMLDPRWMSIVTDPEDIETVGAYIYEFNISDAKGHEIKRRKVTQSNMDSDGNVSSWTITNWINERGKWEMMDSPVEWAYEFAPIVHWKNLPRPTSQYGVSDIADLIPLQDRINFIAGNISKIIRYHGHPKTIGIGFGPDDLKKVDAGPDAFWTINKDNASVNNLEMQSDLVSSQRYLEFMRQSLFDISRTVDISSTVDKLGTLTNFGLRVLYGDALAKLKTKQLLFGEALEELNHRLLVLGGISPDGGGIVVFGDVLPQAEQENIAVDTFELDNKLASRKTIATRRGLDYEQEQERIANDQTAQNENNANIGDMLLRNFDQGSFR